MSRRCVSLYLSQFLTCDYPCCRFTLVIVIAQLICVGTLLPVLSLQTVNTTLPTVPLQTVNIAVLLPYDLGYLFSIEKVLPAIEKAVANITERMASRHQMSLVVRSGDSECNAIGGPLRAFDFYQRKEVDLFLGPVDAEGLSQVSRYAARWNIPVITTGGLAHDFV